MKPYSQPVSLVTAVVPQHRAVSIIDQLVDEGNLIILQTDARGTLVHQHWFKRLLPTMSPEFEYLQFAVRKEQAKALLVKIYELAELHRPGTGAVYVVECDQYVSGNNSFLCEQDLPFNIPSEPPSGYKENIYALYSLIQSGHTETAIRAAVQAGSHGPIVFLSEGRGTRDKVPWLKITKKPYEEVIVTLVNKVDRLAVKEALVNAGRIKTPGGGILYDIPVSQACVNLPATVAAGSQLASTHHMVAAIDELMGHTDWRDCTSFSGELSGVHRQQAIEHTNRCLLALVLPRKNVYEAVDLIIEAGAPGANISFFKQFAGRADRDESGFIKHHEMAMIRLILPVEKREALTQVWLDYIEQHNLESSSIFSHRLSDTVRYSG